MLEPQVDPELPAALLEDTEHGAPADAAEPVPAGPYHLTAKMDLDVIPVMQRSIDRSGALGIGGTKVGDGEVREDHAPAERVIRPVAFEDRDAGIRLAAFREERRVQATWSAANDQHPHARNAPPRDRGTVRAVASNIKKLRVNRQSHDRGGGCSARGPGLLDQDHPPRRRRRIHLQPGDGAGADPRRIHAEV